MSKIKLSTKKYASVVFWGLGTLFLLIAFEFLFWYVFKTITISWFVVGVIGALDLIISLLVAHQRYIQLLSLQIIVQFQNLNPQHMQQLTQIQVHNPWLQQVIKQLLLVTKTMQTAIEQQQQSELTKDNLITNVSHDLRTPLTSIIGFLGLIEQNPQTPINDIQKYVHIAFQKAQQLQSLVNDLFEYMRASTASIQLNYSKFDMIQMLEQLAAEFELQAQQAQIQLIVDSPQKSVIMRADTEKLGRVLNNLITNALQYGKGAKHLWLCAREQGDQVFIQVANDGEPIAKASLEHLFERFYRGDQSRSPVHEGTGLGLAIAQSLIQVHGGKISAQSDTKMTVFNIILPKKFAPSEGE